MRTNLEVLIFVDHIITTSTRDRECVSVSVTVALGQTLDKFSSVSSYVVTNKLVREDQ